jgi:uncharacterized membrane protein YwzB
MKTPAFAAMHHLGEAAKVLIMILVASLLRMSVPDFWAQHLRASSRSLAR